VAFSQAKPAKAQPEAKAAAPKAGAAKGKTPAARAEGPGGVQGAEGPAAKEPEARVERTARGGKVIKLAPIVVEGKIQKPIALIWARPSPQYVWEKLNKDFTPKIVEAVSESPF